MDSYCTMLISAIEVKGAGGRGSCQTQLTRPLRLLGNPLKERQNCKLHGQLLYNAYICHRLKSSWHEMKRGDDIYLSKLAIGWGDVDDEGSDGRTYMPSTAVSISAVVGQHGVRALYVRGREVDKERCIALSTCPISPEAVNAGNYGRFVQFIDDLFVCPGNTDRHFIRMCVADKGTFKTRGGEVASSIDSYLPTVYEGRQHSSTVRARRCQLLVCGAEKRCQQCVAYRGVLRVKFSRWCRSPKATSKFATNANLKTPQRSQKLKRLATVKKGAERKIAQMKRSITKSIREKGVALPQDLHDDVRSVMNAQGEKIDDIYPKGTFRRLFWDQQFKAASAKSASGMRWHPVMIRLALSLKMASSSAYHIM